MRKLTENDTLAAVLLGRRGNTSSQSRGILSLLLLSLSLVSSCVSFKSFLQSPALLACRPSSSPSFKSLTRVPLPAILTAAANFKGRPSLFPSISLDFKILRASSAVPFLLTRSLFILRAERVLRKCIFLPFGVSFPPFELRRTWKEN